MRNSLQTLLTAYQLTAIESNGRLKFMPKSNKPITVIPYHKLLVATGNSKASSFSSHRQQRADLPQRLSINYVDSANDYQISTQSAARADVNSQHSQVMEIPLVLESAQAQQLADDLLHDVWQSRESYQFALGLEYLFLEPGDVIQLQTNRKIHTLAITQLEVGNGQVHVQGVKVEANKT